MINKSFIRVFVFFAAFLVLAQIHTASAAFNRDLYFGLTNDSDVMTLQQTLKAEGCFSSTPTGNFDEATRAGVICFQTKYKFTSVPGSGYVGTYTRSVLNQRLALTAGSSSTINSSTSVIAAKSVYPIGCVSDSGYSTTTGKTCSVIYPSGCTPGIAFNATTGASCSPISAKTYSNEYFSFKYPESMFTLVPVNYTYSPDYEKYTGVKLVPSDLNGRFYPNCDYLNQTSLCGSGPESGIEFAIINHSTVEQVSRLNPARKENVTLVGRPAVKYYFDAATEGVAYYHIQLDGNTALMIKRIYKQSSVLGRFPSDDSFNQVLSTFVLNSRFSAVTAPQPVYPSGCLSSSGFSSITGAPCSITYPVGCSSNTGFSAATGKSCGVNYSPGCTSVSGFSTTTGKSCSPSSVTYTIEIIAVPDGCTSSAGFSTTTGASCSGN